MADGLLSTCRGCYSAPVRGVALCPACASQARPATVAELPAAWAAKPRVPNGTAPRKAYPTPVLDAVLAAMPGRVSDLAIRCGITPEAATRAASLLGKQGRAVAEGTWRKTWRRA